MKKIAFRIVYAAFKFLLLALLSASIFLAGCYKIETSQGGQVMPLMYCGDGYCDFDERSICRADCSQYYGQERPSNDLANDSSGELNWLDRIRQRSPQGSGASQEVVEGQSGYLKLSPVSVRLETALPEKGFIIAAKSNLLSLNESLSSIPGYFSSAEMRQVLGGGHLGKNSEAFGPRFAVIEQFLRVKEGKVLFGFDEDSETVSAFLQYNEGDEILEIVLRVNGGIFKFFEGEIINFLGHEYVIAEVLNNSIMLLGVNTKDSIILRHERSSFVNGREVTTGRHATNYSVDRLTVVVKADEDFKLLPGQSLTQFIPRQALLTNRLDLSFEGLNQEPSINLRIIRTGSNYKLHFQNNLGLNYSVPIAKANPVRAGNNDYNFVYKEGLNGNDYNIKEGDYFALNNARQFGAVTTLLKLSKVDVEDRVLRLEDPALERFLVTIEGNVTAGTGVASLLVYGVSHKVRVSNSRSVSIDLNGDGIVNGASIPIVAWGNSLIKVEELNNSVMLRLITPAQLIENTNKDLETLIVLDDKGITIPQSSLAMSYDAKAERLAGMSTYGTLFLLRKDLNKREQIARELIINQPLRQRLANVLVKAYE